MFLGAMTVAIMVVFIGGRAADVANCEQDAHDKADCYEDSMYGGDDCLVVDLYDESCLFMTMLHATM